MLTETASNSEQREAEAKPKGLGGVLLIFESNLRLRTLPEMRWLAMPSG
jgi:S-adenosylmethionine/arginine decarboxylase-like enzyme